MAPWNDAALRDRSRASSRGEAQTVMWRVWRHGTCLRCYIIRASATLRRHATLMSGRCSLLVRQGTDRDSLERADFSKLLAQHAPKKCRDLVNSLLDWSDPAFDL